ncbi:hypothetical protein H4S07_003678, partial [Coemansia furcata]
MLPRQSLVEPSVDSRAGRAPPLDKVGMGQLLGNPVPLEYEPWRVDSRPETTRVGPGARLLRDLATNVHLLWQDEMTDPAYTFIWLPSIQTEEDTESLTDMNPNNQECNMLSGGILARRPSCKKTGITEGDTDEPNCVDIQTLADMLYAEINYRLGSYGSVVTMHATLDKFGIRSTTHTPPENPVHPMMRREQFAETNANTDDRNILASHARVEEKVRDLVLGYQSVLRTWANGLLREARDDLEALCKNTLVCHKQEPHVESECNAYCMEYGGVPMARLRFLIFANAGYVHMAAVGDQTLVGLELDLARAPVGPDAEEALSKALILLTAALQFDTAGAAHYLTIGHCALLLGQLDVAMSALCSGIGPIPERLGPRCLQSHQELQSCTRLEQIISKRFGPRQWWCAKAIVQTSLVRGDVELAFSIVNRVAELNPDLSHSLLLPPNLWPPVPAPLPAASVLRALDSLVLPNYPGAGEIKEAPVLNIRVDSNRISLIELGIGIIDLFEQSIKSAPETVPFALHTRVDFAIREESATRTNGIALADPMQQVICCVVTKADGFSNTVNDGGCVDSGNVATEQPSICAATDDATDADQDHVSADEADIGCQLKSNKRRESVSGDDMPAKRRSTRFIERASLGVPGSVSNAGQNSAALSLSAGRTSAARISQRRVLALSLDAIESPAYCRARDLASAWFVAAGAATQSEFSDAMSASTFVVSAAAQKVHSGRGVSTKSSVPQSTPGGGAANDDDDKAEWGLADVCSNSKGTSVERFPLTEQRSSDDGNADSQYMDSLKALFKSRSTPEAANQPALDDIVVLGESITSGECQAVLEDNCGVVDLLLRFTET